MRKKGTRSVIPQTNASPLVIQVQGLASSQAHNPFFLFLFPTVCSMEFSPSSIFPTSQFIGNFIFITSLKIFNWRYLIATCNMFLPLSSICTIPWGYKLSISLTICTQPEIVAKNKGVFVSPSEAFTVPSSWPRKLIGLPPATFFSVLE